MLPNQFSFLLCSCVGCLATNHQQPVDFMEDLLDACWFESHLDPWKKYLRVTRCKFSPITFTWSLLVFLHISSVHPLNPLIDWKLALPHVCVYVYGLLQNCYLFTCCWQVGLWLDYCCELLVCCVVQFVYVSCCIHPSLCVCMYVLLLA